MYCSVSFLKSCESLSFLVRDVVSTGSGLSYVILYRTVQVHITPENFSACVAAIRTFVEAAYHGEGGERRGEGGAGGGVPGRRQQQTTARSAVKRTPRGRSAPARRARTDPRGGSVVCCHDGLALHH